MILVVFSSVLWLASGNTFVLLVLGLISDGNGTISRVAPAVANLFYQGETMLREEIYEKKRPGEMQ